VRRAGPLAARGLTRGLTRELAGRLDGRDPHAS
jgi:hypothetical protein